LPSSERLSFRNQKKAFRRASLNAGAAATPLKQQPIAAAYSATRGNTTMLDRTTSFGPGHNGPPSSIDLAQDTLSALADWLKDNPAITTEDEARAAKLMKDRGDAGMKDLKDEHEKLYRPLKDQIDELAKQYEIRNLMARVISELKARIDRFINAERLRRQALAEAAQRVAAEKATL